MVNPDFSLIAKAYGIKTRFVENRKDLEDAVSEMLSDDSPFILEVHVEENGMVMPMVPPGKGINQIMLTDKEWFENV
jgi:acetolactate synthase-1/2/3 large subunit